MYHYVHKCSPAKCSFDGIPNRVYGAREIQFFMQFLSLDFKSQNIPRGTGKKFIQTH